MGFFSHQMIFLILWNWLIYQWRYHHFICFHFNPKCEKQWGGPEKYLLVHQTSAMVWGHIISCCWSTVFSEIQSQHRWLPRNWRALNASFCWKALWRCRFYFTIGLGSTLPKVPKSGWMTMMFLWFTGWQTHLNWTLESLWAIERRKMRDTKPNNSRAEGHCQSNLGLTNTTGELQTDLCLALHLCSNSCSRGPNQVSSAYKWTYFQLFYVPVIFHDFFF